MTIKVPVAAVLLAALIAGGCEPAPSTKLAPDVPVPDTSHLTPEQIKAMHGGPASAPADRTKPGG